MAQYLTNIRPILDQCKTPFRPVVWMSVTLQLNNWAHGKTFVLPNEAIELFFAARVSKKYRYRIGYFFEKSIENCIGYKFEQSIGIVTDTFFKVS